MQSRRSIIAVVACLHQLQVPLSYAWSCKLTMIGSSVQPQNLSAARTSLECDPGADEMGTTLTVGVSQELRSDTFPGASLQLLSHNLSQALRTPFNFITLPLLVVLATRAYVPMLEFPNYHLHQHVFAVLLHRNKLAAVQALVLMLFLCLTSQTAHCYIFSRATSPFEKLT